MPVSEEKSYRFDRFVVDARSACLRRDGIAVPLRPKSFDVLLHLVRNRGRLVTKNELIENVWSNVFVTDNSLVQCVKEVRQALGDDQQTIIETVAKRGYIFTPNVLELDSSEAVASRAPIHAGPSSVERAPVAALPVQAWWPVVATAGSVAAFLIAGGLWWVLSVRPESS